MDAAQSPTDIMVSITVLKQLFLYLDSLSVDMDAFLTSIGVDPAITKSPDEYIPIETYLTIQDEAADYTEDPYFGLHMGEFAEAGSWSILGYLMMNCKNLGEAFQKSARYYRIIGTLIRGENQIKLNKVKSILSTPPHAPQMSRHCFESTLSSSVRMMRNLTGEPLNPLEITFSHSAPESTEEYERIFQCPVLFDQPETSITLDIRLAFTPVLFANPGLMAYFENYAQEFIAKMDYQQETIKDVTRIILANLDDEKLTIRRVAKELAMSVRTLQNRLKDEGVVFSDLLMEIRENLAKKYLKENYTVEEITYLLGYSEPSVFRKAFKKWSGYTPKEYREISLSALG